MDATPDTSEPVTPEVLDIGGLATPGGAEAGSADGESEQVTKPTKLIRIASMVRQMLEEVRRAPLDDAGRRRLREIHEKSVHELKTVLSPELQAELEEVVLPFTSEAPSESELRLAQAQLVGWLEGLFHGIQATLFTQQSMAQGQLEQVRRHALETGGAEPGPGNPGGSGIPGVPGDPGGPGGPPSGYL
ncbi:MAG: bacterial proteasome activator family protein [Acidimicrobiia bacterium]|nr:bacterial proteasome activator family protein [Acidimicrobiia bacterium]